MAMIFIVTTWLFIGTQCATYSNECINNLTVHNVPVENATH